MLGREQKAQLPIAAKRLQAPAYKKKQEQRPGRWRLEMARRGRWSALGGAWRPRPAPAAAHRPCRSPGPHPAHLLPGTTAQAPIRRPIWPPWPPDHRRRPASCTHLSALYLQPTNPSDHRAPWQSPRDMCGGVGALERPRARSRWVNGLVSFQITFLSCRLSWGLNEGKEVTPHVAPPVPSWDCFPCYLAPTPAPRG